MNWFINLHPILQGLIATTFTYLVTMLGASMVFFVKKINRKVMDFSLGFASGIMIAASFFSLLLPAISLLEDLGRLAYLETSLGFLAGGFFVILSDLLFEKIMKTSASTKKSIMVTSAVTIHNIPEGMVVGVAFGSLAAGISDFNIYGAILIAIGIGLQNFPEGLTISFPLRSEGVSRFKSFFIGQISGFVEPIFGVLGVIFALTTRNILPFLLSFSAGAMISVVGSELIPDSFKDNKLVASLGLILGFMVMMFLDVALG